MATPFICSMADRHKSHRSYFTLSLIFTTIALCFYALLPLLELSTDLSSFSDVFREKETRVNHSSSLLATSADGFSVLLAKGKPGDDNKRLLVGPWIYYCLTSLLCDLSHVINTCLADSFAILQAEEFGTSFGRIIVWGTFGWASSAIALGVINQWKVLPLLLPGLLFSVVLLTIDVFIVVFWPRASDFKLDSIPTDAASTLTGKTSPTHRDPIDYMPLDKPTLVDLHVVSPDTSDTSKRGRIAKNSEAVSDEILRDPESSMTVDTPFKTDSLKTIESGQDSDQTKDVARSDIVTRSQLSSEPLKNDDHNDDINPFESYKGRRQRAPTGSQVVERDSRVRCISNSGSTESKKVRAATKQFTSLRMQLILFGIILQQHKSLIRYLLLFVLSGFFMSMHWNYFFLYLEDIYYEKFALISALSMVGQSILGELPFFILSRKVIDYFGRSYTLSISLISIGVRFLLYAYMLPNYSMYLIVFADCLQGPNYGLFYVVMTEVGLEYSFCDEATISRLAARGEIDRDNKRQVDAVRLSLRSTVQSMAYVCYEGIGVGIGSLTGGWLKHSYGFTTLWTYTAAASISVGVINALLELCVFEKEPADMNSERRDFMEARKAGTLKKVTQKRLL